MFSFSCKTSRTSTIKTCLYFAIFCNLGSRIYGDLITNVNNAIIQNLKDGYTIEVDRSRVEKLISEVIDGCGKTRRHGTDTESVLELQACDDSSFNVTQCRAIFADQCIRAEDILQRTTITDTDIQNIFPVLLHTITNPHCSHDEFSQNHASRKHEKTPSWKAWMFACLFGLVLCLISNIGAFMAPIMKTAFFKRLLLFCVGLAVGTMAATGFLVLIPESMSLTGEDSPVPDYKYKLSCSLGAIYMFYVTEKILKKLFKRRSDKRKAAKALEIDALNITEVVESNSLLNDTKDKVNGHVEKSDVEKAENHGHSHGLDKGSSIATVAYVLMTGDSLHKFVDGVSVGAAFTENVYVGFSVSLAIVCEELPHELGDIAILLQSGVPMKKALLVNTLTAAVSFLGIAVGILLGENTDANMWIFAVAGGMFIYIALIDMIPEMDIQAEHVIETQNETQVSVFLLQNIGLILGFVIMLLISLYGGDINI